MEYSEHIMSNEESCDYSGTFSFTSVLTAVQLEVHNQVKLLLPDFCRKLFLKRFWHESTRTGCSVV